MKKHSMLFIGIMLVLVMLTACNQTISTPEASASPGAVGTVGTAYQKITAEDGKALFDNGVALTLVDVRRTDEYETAHIPGAINIPNESIESAQPNELPELEKTVVVYCRTGVRSKQAADKLVEMGYTDVRDMGGIVDWPYDTVSGKEPGEYVKADGNNLATDHQDEPLGPEESNIDRELSKTDNVGSVVSSPRITSPSAKPTNSPKPTGTPTVSQGIMGNFSAKDLNGNNINQSIFAQYELTMVNVWATYCGPCLSEMPDLGELADEYEGKGVRIVGVVVDVLNSNGTVNNSQLDTARTIIASTGADYTHIIPSAGLNRLMSQVTAVPTTFFIDNTGTQVGKSYVGSRSKAEWKNIIAQMLEEARK